jgi:hypothetical protein
VAPRHCCFLPAILSITSHDVTATAHASLCERIRATPFLAIPPHVLLFPNRRKVAPECGRSRSSPHLYLCRVRSNHLSSDASLTNSNVDCALALSSREPGGRPFCSSRTGAVSKYCMQPPSVLRVWQLRVLLSAGSKLEGCGWE